MKSEQRATSDETALLEGLGRHVREAQKDDARFDRVSDGTAEAAELAELSRLAAADPEIALRLEASRPLGDAAVDRIAARVATSVPAVAPAKREPAKVVSLRTAWMRRVATVAAPLALAAGVMLYVAAGPKAGGGAELPSYGVSASGEQAMRGPADPSARLRIAHGKDARFEVVLRPATAPATKVVAYAFTVGGAGAEPNALEAKVEVSAEGAVRISGPSRMLDGATEIRLVVGAPEAIGKFDDAIVRAKSGAADRQVRVIIVPIDRP